MVIGLLIGLLVAKVRIPSFVVTLAFFLAFQGVALYIVNNGPGAHGDVRITDARRARLRELPDAQVGRLDARGRDHRRLRGREAVARSGPAAARGLLGEPTAILAAKIGALTFGTLLVVFLLNQNRSINRKPILTNVDGTIKLVTPPAVEGVPWVVLVLVVLLRAVDLRALAHPLRPAHLRRRRQRGGLAPGRHHRRPGPHLGLRALLVHGRRRRHHDRLERGSGLACRTTPATRCCSRSAPP